MDAGNHQRGIQKAEQRRAYRGETAGHHITYRKGHTVADHTTKRADNGVGEKDGQYQRTDRDDNQVEIIRHDALQARFNKLKRQSRQ